MAAAAHRGVTGISALLPVLLMLAAGLVESGGGGGGGTYTKWNAAFGHASRGLVPELRRGLSAGLFGGKSAVDVDAQSPVNGDTLLHAAVRPGHLEIVALLVSDKHSANVQLPNAASKGLQVR